MCLIYKMFNTVNDKVYISHTSSDLKEAWMMHWINRYVLSDDLHKALRLYTKNLWDIEPIETVDDSHAKEREGFWIEYYRT